MGHDLPRHYGLEDLEWVPLGETGWHRASITLDVGDTAWSPTSDDIYGPKIVTYERAPSRSITVLAEDIPDA